MFKRKAKAMGGHVVFVCTCGESVPDLGGSDGRLDECQSDSEDSN